MTSIEVVRPGALTTIQDLGRPGFAHIAVPRSGAADPPSLRLANALTGNEPGAAALEITLAGPALRFDGAALIALTGAPAPASIDGRPVAFGEPVAVGAGEVLDVGQASAGVRTYIAVGGGIDVEPVLASRATDTLTGLGPAPLRRGDVLALGRPADGADRPGGGAVRDTDLAAAGVRPTDSGAFARPLLRILAGPRADLFAPSALAALTLEPFAVSPTSNRVGVRLTGPRLERRDTGELPSEGLVHGAIQVPTSGEPILMLADHPTTGGYPVIAVVVESDHGLAGQLRPGTAVRFALVQRW